MKSTGELIAHAVNQIFNDFDSMTRPAAQELIEQALVQEREEMADRIQELDDRLAIARRMRKVAEGSNDSHRAKAKEMRALLHDARIALDPKSTRRQVAEAAKRRGVTPPSLFNLRQHLAAVISEKFPDTAA